MFRCLPEMMALRSAVWMETGSLTAKPLVSYPSLVQPTRWSSSWWPSKTASVTSSSSSSSSSSPLSSSLSSSLSTAFTSSGAATAFTSGASAALFSTAAERQLPDRQYGPTATKVEYLLPHPKWTEEELDTVATSWASPQNAREWVAQTAIRIIRFNFDILTGFRFKPTEARWLTRMVFLETIAGVPGFCGAAIRHLRSLRLMERDRGWIHSLVGEAENERMHLLSFLEMRKPGPFMRFMVALSQGVFWNFYFLVFLLSPKLAFSVVCQLEVQAVKTYTHCLEEIEHGSLQHWKTQPAPEIAKKYWQLGEQGTVKDMIRHIRADEAHHRHVNHVFSNLRPYQDANPFDI